MNRTLTDAGIEVASAVSVSRSDAMTAGHLTPVIFILLGVALPLGVVGAIGLASTMGANILERTREFGIMHAIGARPRAVRRIVVAEGVFLALTSCVVAALPTLGLTAALGVGLGNLFMYAPLPFRISWLAAGIWLALVVLGSILATEAAATLRLPYHRPRSTNLPMTTTQKRSGFPLLVARATEGPVRATNAMKPGRSTAEHARTARREALKPIMAPRLRKFVLTAHITSSVGLLGATLPDHGHHIDGLLSP